MTDILSQIDATLDAVQESMRRNAERFDPFGPDCRAVKGSSEEVSEPAEVRPDAEPWEVGPVAGTYAASVVVGGAGLWQFDGPQVLEGDTLDLNGERFEVVSVSQGADGVNISVQPIPAAPPVDEPVELATGGPVDSPGWLPDALDGCDFVMPNPIADINAARRLIEANPQYRPDSAARVLSLSDLAPDAGLHAHSDGRTHPGCPECPPAPLPWWRRMLGRNG
jgi:hypothetical protein